MVRSRTRRILREGLRAIEKKRALKVGYLIVIAARTAATKLKSYDIERELDIAFRKLSMYADEKIENGNSPTDNREGHNV